MARRYAPDHLLHALALPGQARDAVLPLMGLAAELEHVREAAKEPMLAQLRYAWWQEQVDHLHSGNAPPSHPVLQALSPVIMLVENAAVDALIAQHRQAHPAPASEARHALEAACEDLLATAWPEALPRWRKSAAIIARHRARFGARRQTWLTLRLLFS